MFYNLYVVLITEAPLKEVFLFYMRFIRFHRYFLPVFAFCFFALSGAHAQEWRPYNSDSGLFKVRMPENVQEDVQNFRIGPDLQAQSGQAMAIIDQRPYRDHIKYYIVRFDQSLGAYIEKSREQPFIKRDLDRFAQHYDSMNVEILQRNDNIYRQGIPGGEIVLSYDDENGKRQYIKMYVFVSGALKIQQMMIGARKDLDFFISDKYFDSFYIKSGYKAGAGDIRTEWPAHSSPLGLFTAYLPEKVFPYAPGEIQIFENENHEKMSIQFYDPLWDQSLFYNIYGYKMPKGALEYSDVEQLLKENHISRHRFKPSEETKIQRMTNNGLPVIEATYSIEPPPSFPYANFVRLRALFSGDSVLVHEVVGADYFVKSNFADYVVRSVDFHPEQAVQGEQAKPDTPDQ